MKRLAALLFFLCLPTLAAAQVNLNALGPNVVIGRQGIPTQGGPAQAIPFAALVQALSAAQPTCTANTVMAGPSAAGPAAVPSCRALVAADIPATSLFTQRVITAAGGVTVTATDDQILINKAAPATTAVTLPAASTRSGRPLVVKDLARNAAAFNITLTPNGVETIDGAANLVISINGSEFDLVPISGTGWAIK